MSADPTQPERATRTSSPSRRHWRRRAGFALLVPAGLLALAGCGSSSKSTSATTVASGGGSATTASGGSSSATTASAGASGATATLKIGEIDSMTGTFAQYGVPQHQAIELAFNQINAAGGLKVGNTTYKLSINLLDDKTDAATGALDMQKLLGEGIHFITGTLSSAVAEAYLPLIKNRTDVIDMVSGAADNGLNDTNAVYRPRVTQGQYVPAEIAEMQTLVSPSVSPHIGNMYDQGNAGAVSAAPQIASMMKSLGYTVNQEPFTAGSPQFGSQINGIVSAGDKAIFFGGDASDCAVFIKEARQQGYKGDIISTVGFQASNITGTDIPASDMVGEYDMQAATPTDLQAAGTNIGKFTTFAADFQSAYKTPPGFTSASAFDAAYILADALQIAGSVTNYAAIHTALNNMTLAQAPQVVEAVIPQGGKNLIFNNHQSYFKLAIHTWNGKAFVLQKIISNS